MRHHERRYDHTLPETSVAWRVERPGVRGPQGIIRQAVEAELGTFVEEHAGAHDAQDRRAVVHNGYLLSREVLTGIGPVRFKFETSEPKVKVTKKADNDRLAIALALENLMD